MKKQKKNKKQKNSACPLPKFAVERFNGCHVQLAPVPTSGAMIYPENVELDVGNDSVVDWNQTGALNTTATIRDSLDLAGLLNSQLSSCSCPGCIDLETECAIPLIIHSDTRELIDVSIYYESIPKGARLIVEPPSTTVEVNDTFIINITIARTDIYAAEYELTFDSGILEPMMIEEGEFLKQDGASIFDYTVTINDDTIVYVITRLNNTGGDEGGITGEGRLTWIKFRAKDEGTTDLHINNYNISNSNISEIEKVTTFDGKVEVGGEVEFVIPLYTGWNLISIPAIPENNSITAVLSSLGTGKGTGNLDYAGMSGCIGNSGDDFNGTYTSVFSYNASDTADHWKTYNPNTPCFAIASEDLQYISPGNGYWIKMTQTDNLDIEP